MASSAHACRRIRVFETGSARTGHQFSGTERFVVTVITIDLPTVQSPAGIDDFPAAAPENALYIDPRLFEEPNRGAKALIISPPPKIAELKCRRHHSARTKTVRAAVITNVIVAVNRRRNSPAALFYDRAQKIARVSSPVQTAFGHARRVESALESKTGFLWRVIKRADDEVFAGVSTGTPR